MKWTVAHSYCNVSNFYYKNVQFIPLIHTKNVNSLSLKGICSAGYKSMKEANTVLKECF